MFLLYNGDLIVYILLPFKEHFSSKMPTAETSKADMFRQQFHSVLSTEGESNNLGMQLLEGC